MRCLISGKSGQLAKAFLRRLTERGVEYLAPEEPEFDITDPDRAMEICGFYRPDVIINCAAYNLVDKAEGEPERAFGVNALGPGHLARAARKYGAFLVHFGSDYVFDGTKEDGLYDEKDAPSPINRYGMSKLDGEKRVKEETDDFLILRLSWVFGEGNQNFIRKLLGWAQGSEYLRIVCDEFSVPTYTHTVADITLRAMEKRLTGLYHLTNTGYCSRYEWAAFVLKRLGIKKFIRPVSMESFNLPARRPGFSAMSNKRISKELDVEIPSWERAVESYLESFSNG
jgi:dTDP-4-dehydrorhamnose reductase